MVEYKGNLLIFGGTNGVKTLNDMWNFNLTSKKWEKLECLDTPEVIIIKYSLAGDTQWLTTKIISLCSEEFKMLLNRKTIFTFISLIKTSGIKFIPQQILSMIVRQHWRKTQGYIYIYLEK